MKYRFMDEQRKYHSVRRMAELLSASRSGYYRWAGHGQSGRARSDEEVVERIREIQEQAKRRYGSPRVTKELGRGGCAVGHNRVARLMRRNDLARRIKKRTRSTTDSAHKLLVAENLVNRQFTVAKPNLVWVSDITYIATAEGWLYLCVVIDLYSRKVVGWAMDSRMKARLVVNAMMMALMHRGRPGGVIFHSDRGSQYCSQAVRRRIRDYRMQQSMSRKGNCWDNAPSESFFSTLKRELCGNEAFVSRADAQSRIFEYIEVFYNRQRLHSTIGYLTPVEFEQEATEKVS